MRILMTLTSIVVRHVKKVYLNQELILLGMQDYTQSLRAGVQQTPIRDVQQGDWLNADHDAGFEIKNPCFFWNDYATGIGFGCSANAAKMQ